MRCLVIGCGYLGRRVAQLWLARGDEVYALTRRIERANELSAAGLTPLIGDINTPSSLPPLPSVDTLLFAVGFDRQTGQAIHDVYVQGLQHALHALTALPRTFVYISSTGVYGGHHGEFVDEQTPCVPTRDGGRACLAAEQLLQAHDIGARTIILRCAGLYGPGRVPYQRALANGEPLAVPPDGFLNLIHIDDAAAITVAAADRLATPVTLNVTDGHPVQRGEYYREVARCLGAPPPRFAPPDPHSPATARAENDKRVRADRLAALLPLELRYPTYREGLAAVLAPH